MKHKFHVKGTPIKNDKGWDYILVEIFDHENKIGEYIRTYPYQFKTTFFPFEQDKEWFALYSKDYTATRVMQLPSCEDLCGEDENKFGFCPAHFYVPFGKDFKDEEDTFENTDGKEYKYTTIRSNINGKIGFVAGCVWGDDSNWKIQFLDLSKIKDKIFVRDDRFGYIELPINLSLKKAINMSLYDKNDYSGIEIAVAKRFILNLDENKE